MPSALPAVAWGVWSLPGACWLAPSLPPFCPRITLLPPLPLPHTTTQAYGAIEAYGVHLVVANELHSRKDRVWLVTQRVGGWWWGNESVARRLAGRQSIV